jgi:hypothetical protein
MWRCALFIPTVQNAGAAAAAAVPAATGAPAADDTTVVCVLHECVHRWQA